MDDFKHTSIDFEIIQTCGEELVGSEIERLFRSEFKVPYITVGQSLNSPFDHQNGLTVSRGKMGFKKLTEGLVKFLKIFSKRNLRPILISFEDTLFTFALSNDAFVVSHQIKLRSLSMGTIARLNSFVVHYSTQKTPFRHKTGREDYWVSVSGDDMLARFLHSKNELHIHFRIIWKPHEERSPVKYKYQRLKLVLTYKSVNHLIFGEKDSSLSSFVSISHPPNLFVLKRDIDERVVYKKDFDEEEDKENTNYGIEFERDVWIRRTECACFTKDVFGGCNTLKIDLYKHGSLEDVPAHKLDEYPSPFEVINSMLKFKKCRTYFGGMVEIEKSPPQPIAIKMDHKDSFKIVYALSSLQSISYQFANELLLKSSKNKMDLDLRPLKEELQTLSNYIVIFERSLYDLFHVIKSGSFVQCLFFLRNAFERNAREMLDFSIVQDIIQIRRAVLTPTRTVLLPPLPVMESRFLRRSNPDYVLRLYVRDDDLRKLTFSLRMMEERDRERFTRMNVKRPLVLGIRIGDRLYKVIGSSPSQIRDNGMCLYAKDDKGRTARQIRGKFGVISESSVSKYVSHVGLMLSQTQFLTDASDAKVKYKEPDIIYENVVHSVSKKPYNFSDGCGMISTTYATKLTEELRKANFLPENESSPSAFQIRFKGIKGLLVQCPTLKNYDMVIRNSMQKFISEDKLLGVLKVSDVRSVYLNQPLITLLNQLGVETNVFLKMQWNVLQDILHCFVSEKNAANILEQYCWLQSSVDFCQLIAANVNILSEPFFRLSLDSVIKHTTHLLKAKSRIMIPLKDGRTMFGCVDETKTLKYGQVFVQATVSLKDRSATEIWKGKVLVTKFPCMAPGDVRILEAVDVKSLHHIRDCIVFPAVGKRPHPNEMAGSDLDGDEFAVIRYEPLLNITTKDAMEYPDPPASKPCDKITSDHILSYYVAGIENDSLGVIAKAHIAWADMLPNGILDPKCEQLALDYSRALDAPKTGESVVLQKEQKPSINPDFMEKFSHKPTYLSQRALGSLFRQICLFEMVFNEQNPLTVEGVDMELFSHPNFQMFSEQANKAYNDYKLLVKNIQKMFKIETESEIINGVYINVDDFMSGKEEMSDARVMVSTVLRNGVTKIREIFESNCTDDEQRLAKASAYYQVTRQLNSRSSTPYYGLPWLFSRYLSSLAIRNRSARIRFETENTRLIYLGNMITDELFRRKKFTESDIAGMNLYSTRVKLAKNIIVDWIINQTHLKLSFCDSRDMAERLFEYIREDEEQYEIPSVGMIVISMLKKCMETELTPQFGAETVAKEFKYTVGFSSLMALYRLYRTHCVDHIVTPRIINTMNSNQICLKTFRLQFNMNSQLYEFVKVNESKFFMHIRKLTKVAVIKGEWLQRGSSNWYLEVIAFATHAQMYALGYVLSKILFANGPRVLSTLQNAVCGSSRNSRDVYNGSQESNVTCSGGRQSTTAYNGYPTATTQANGYYRGRGGERGSSRGRGRGRGQEHGPNRGRGYQRTQNRIC